jgi:hypothetical protein
MCKPHTYSPVNDYQFKTWKSNSSAKGIEFTGDTSGEFKWGPVSGSYAWTAVKGELIVELNISSTDDNCDGMYFELGQKIPKVADDSPVTPPGPALAIDDGGKYTVIGRVLRSGIVQAGLRVQAWDADKIGTDDKLGNDYTDEKGFFKISFDPSAFNDWGLDRDPDLYFKIFDDKDMIGETSGAVIKNAKPGIKDIVINLTR